MYCEKCGAQLTEGAKFCDNCGAPVILPGSPAEAPGPQAAGQQWEGQIEGQKVTENIYLCPDGMYRWFYEFDMIRNPTILFTVWKVIGMAFAIVAVMWIIADLFQRIDIWPHVKLLAILFLVLCFLAIPAYLIVAAVFGWKYIVLFEMDEEKVSHIPTEKQFKKAQALNWLTMVTAVAAKNRGAFSAGMLAGTKGPSTSIFKEVQYLRIRRKQNTINVDYTLDKNPIYVEDADFDFVEKFIKDRCVKAKIC